MRRAAIVIAFLILVVGGGLLIGAVNRPDGWYASLVKPPFNPPGAVFGPVWTLLYVLIAFAGARTFERGRGAALALWAAQLALNFAWSPVFFGLHRPGAALLVVAALLVAVLAFIAERWRRDRVAAYLFVPYAAWAAFATLLNASIWWLNG